MTRTDGVQLISLVALIVGAAAFVLWYFAPRLPFDIPLPDAATIKPVPRVATASPHAVSEATAQAPTLAVVAQPTTAAILGPYCQPGKRPEFVLGFAQLKARLGDTMGTPVECEHTNLDNGDNVQLTSTGLAVYRKSTGALEFTDGWHHWALTGETLTAWEGDARPT